MDFPTLDLYISASGSEYKDYIIVAMVGDSLMKKLIYEAGVVEKLKAHLKGFNVKFIDMSDSALKADEIRRGISQRFSLSLTHTHTHTHSLTLFISVALCVCMCVYSHYSHCAIYSA